MPNSDRFSSSGYAPFSADRTAAPQVDATMQAVTQWLSEMKLRSSQNLSQIMGEMGMVRDGITSNSTDLNEYKRHNMSMQQQMQSSLSELQEKLSHAVQEITTMVKQKTATDDNFMKDVNSIQQQLSMKTAELESLKKEYSATHQKTQSSIIHIQGQLQIASGDIQSAKQKAEFVQDIAQQRMSEVDRTMKRIRAQLEATGREGQSQTMHIQENIASLHGSLIELSQNLLDHKKSTIEAQNSLSSRFASLRDAQEARKT
eukprot:TRINITY_DN7104_c0_g1_i1.p1 TRINITY_DN7104_c0_g1~~TRINITY_DN7104_c0_g1_i1.p1  ORF type:complete len:285 (+),score=39.36 TRINITY_DN7104_c0_g1_i1:81-857(+)